MSEIRFILVLTFSLLTCCKHSTNAVQEVRVRLPQDPENINPITYTNTQGLQIINLLFQSLLYTSGTQATLEPLLAQSLPVVQRSDSTILITYRLRPQATWDNGKPVTGNDVDFSMKLIKCPGLNNEKLRMRYEAVQAVLTDSTDHSAVTFVCDKNTADPVRLTGALFILPLHIYDPDNLLKSFSLQKLTTHFDSLKTNNQIRAYAEWFGKESVHRQSQFLNGSGGYKVRDWQTGEHVILERKEKWWPATLADKPNYLTANPPRINFHIIPDNTTALRALTTNGVDVYSNIPATDFVNLMQDQNFRENYSTFTPETHDFTYIGINSRDEKFANRLTRQALAHLLDVPAFIKVTQKNFATRTIAPLKPDDPFYNRQIRAYEYNPQKAVQLLKQAGWENINGQWKKFISEAAIPLEINLQYRAGNTEYENIALIFQQAAQQIGVPVDIQPVEGSTLTDNLRAHKFDMFIRGISGSPGEYDYKSILHTESAEVGGNNYPGFGTPESDKLIEAINDASNDTLKAQLLFRFQEILHTEANPIFLYTAKNRIAVNNRLTNTRLTTSKYGFDVSAFTFSAQ
ncbi:ABC transporter substrate-binding protein [Rhodocytophaga aerolata]|uniref:ABC transporter substrate-binding protein n=1 Tax=Rhodocytophaga aerolata TaxID=455078 RepID=A0ABT8RGP5_9BACT|nr:ABC transporter substrate-binding protein [Rhodocytophaga aerolata]MDO1450323.1 ABC transporter substrate-binding protein [Rhodocytophaga aerolata]